MALTNNTKFIIFYNNISVLDLIPKVIFYYFILLVIIIAIWEIINLNNY